ncbi:MAG: 50S ribosomal protein L29 [Candidatus Nealsonbacteria bacterium CG03_land_8_20_14_0_80_36_12]|uniref:Large ribosomal subunit protein uL29 n=1 Tax=Candidatus Nealsonbacteria bacterium CG03_land_8_20_14_0_80_36_12 TaxID=1974701 RepID=A0A2M7BYN0_9BACT|nr:MAG: 50S ribosomal protein L29 [Candidatus Nealsonbacteria bacterium CG03_land_8_20_14_0_80_36_12]
MKTKELGQKNQSSLKNILRESREKLRQLRFDLAAGKVKNVKEIREIKKDIAKILTILKSKEK